jgi:hypothetical protein
MAEQAILAHDRVISVSVESQKAEGGKA